MDENLILKDIYIYPIKSLGGIAVNEAEVHETGLQYDRRWMLTDLQGNFLTQRVFPKMALLQVNIVKEGLLVNHKRGLFAPLMIRFDEYTHNEVTVQIWDDTCKAQEVSAAANAWFSHALQMPVQLVYMPDTTQRYVDTNYAGDAEIVSFADAYPFLIIGQSSLDDLNSRLAVPVPINRFRPNFVFTGGTPYCEDTFDTFTIGKVTFKAVKPCARCVLTTVDQELAVKGMEPLKTLASYRTNKNKVMFGQNLLRINSGTVTAGDPLKAEYRTC